MELSAEDNLRLNVLLSQDLHAVRIDESKMTVFALTAKGEAKVPLNAIGKDEAYIKEIKALFSTHVMGSPGGYPIYLKRWTRMGQARDESLAQLLLLGEPEAVVAAVHAQGLTDELAARAWWAMPTSDNARRMLEKQAVVEGNTGKVLADFLIEFLPFEEEQKDMIESVRLVLQPGLISEQEKEKLWAKTKSKRSFYVGFLLGAADDLPIEVEQNDLYDEIVPLIQPLLAAGNAYAVLLEKVLSGAGQAFLKTAQDALKKPGNQDVVVLLLEAIAQYFKPLTQEAMLIEDIGVICEQADELCCSDESDICAVLGVVGERQDEVKKYLCAMMVLSCLSVKLVNPVFARTDAIGTVMRKKIKPITDPIEEQIKVLRS